MRADQIKSYMNEYGRKKMPFLFAIDFNIENAIFIDNPLKNKDILFSTPLGNNKSEVTGDIRTDKKMEAIFLSFSEYEKRFSIVLEGLKGGNSYLTNLTVRTPIETTLSLFDIFKLSNSLYQLYIPDNFVCFSPERFVKIAKGKISTNPMKGTINAAIPDAEKIILSDPKETAEHYTIVDLLRNDIGMVAKDVKVDRFRYIDRIKTGKGEILQVSSEITGTLPNDYLEQLGDIIFRMLPAGSISGAPKQSTLEIIRRAEKESRGYYTGIFGYFNGSELDTGVLIRFIEKDGEQLYFHSGGGITVYSDPESEYNEVNEKIYLP